MVLFKLFTSWLPHTLRQQFLLAISVLTLLILAGGGMAVYTLNTSATTIHLLAEHRLLQMQEAQDLVRLTFLIERKTYQLEQSESHTQLHTRYGEILEQLSTFDKVVDRLAAESEGNALLELHRASQLFRNTTNIAAQLREKELQADRKHPDMMKSEQHYLKELHKQAEELINATQVQSAQFTRYYRESVQQLNNMTQSNVRWVTFLLVGSLMIAGMVAQWFLGRHVLGRLQQVSHDLRIDANTTSTGKEEYAHRCNVPFHDEIDEMAHAVELFWEDRRHLGQRTIDLIQARDAAEMANKSKSLFLANMSHELRTPLNTILGFSDILRQDPLLNNNQRQNIDIITLSSEYLLTLINDILEIAKIESGKLHLQISPFDIDAMIRNILEMMRIHAEHKGLQLHFEQSSEFPHYIKGDEARIRQILINLISNAIKFTEKGSVNIRLSIKHNLRDHLIIEIQDTGPGITLEDQKHLFPPFVQFTKETPKRLRGWGLTIARQFAQLMGGNIVLISEPLKGSLFQIELPLIVADEDEVRHHLLKRVEERTQSLKESEEEYIYAARIDPC
ncbi:sensor histidine kinase [Sulfuricurvum sp.]|uniref:sensor histidine kinase n=1 Tax=Sulfuricurvum sp. TaxID=2025608 RepID=UPI00356B11AF